MQFQQTNGRMGMVASSAASIEEWWSRLCTGGGTKEENREEITRAAYIAWHIWKERNRRVFEQKELTPIALAGLIRDEINVYDEATRTVVAGGM